MNAVAGPVRARTTAPHTTRSSAGTHVATAAGVVQPRRELQPADVRGGRGRDCREREQEEERPALAEPGSPLPREDDRVRGREIEKPGEERQIARPVQEAREEARAVAERAARPDVEAALVGMAGRQLEHRGGERNEEAERGEDPDGERRRPGFRRGRDPAQREARQREEEDEVPEPEDLPQRHLSGPPSASPTAGGSDGRPSRAAARSGPFVRRRPEAALHGLAHGDVLALDLVAELHGPPDLSATPGASGSRKNHSKTVSVLSGPHRDDEIRGEVVGVDVQHQVRPDPQVLAPRRRRPSAGSARARAGGSGRSGGSSVRNVSVRYAP